MMTYKGVIAGLDRAIQPLFLLVIARLVRAIQSYDLMR